MSEVPKEAAKRLMLAKAAYHREWLKYYHGVAPLAGDKFETLRQSLRDEIAQFKYGYKRSNGVSQAADELFRQVLTGESPFTYEEVVGFAKGYSDLKRRLSRALYDTIQDVGDDGYGDLIDSLAVAATPELLERSLATDPKSRRPRRDGLLDYKEFKDAVKELGSPWNKFVGSEEYVESSLEEAARKRFLGHIRDQIEWTVEEEKALSWG